MIIKKYTKCAICGKDEKYSAWVKIGNENIKVKTCKNDCNLQSTPKDNKWQ